MNYVCLQNKVVPALIKHHIMEIYGEVETFLHGLLTSPLDGEE
jgi:hypothetical protein